MDQVGCAGGGSNLGDAQTHGILSRPREGALKQIGHLSKEVGPRFAVGVGVAGRRGQEMHLCHGYRRQNRRPGG